MKSHELVERINNGEIKDGTMIDGYKNNRKVLTLYWDGKALRYKEDDSYVLCNDLFFKEVEFEIVEEHKGWFKPEYDEMYYCINTSGQINCYRWDGGEFDLYHYNNHNCFRSKKEAQEYLDYKNALKETEKPFVIGKKNWAIYYSHDDKEVEICWTNGAKHQGTTYLGQDKDVAQAFIDKWKPQILKFEFDVWE